MKLTVFKRLGKKKSDLTRLRALKDIFVKGQEFAAIMRYIEKNHLSNTCFQLNLDGTNYKAVVKGIQYQKTTYQPLHIDFLLAGDEDFVNVAIPITCINAIDCVGIKLGGVLRTVIRSLLVRCKLKDIPKHFMLDVKEMNIGGNKKLADIELPANVTPLLPMNEVAITNAKR